jgi:hypothetical protein
VRFTRNDPDWQFSRYDDPDAPPLAIEALALPDEAPGHLSALLQGYIDEIRPAGRTEQALVEQLAVSTIEKERILRARTAILAQKVRTATFRFDQSQEAEVQALVELLPAQPARALAGLNRSAAGTRYQISRWERLAAILEVEPTWQGQDRDEVAILLGAKPGLSNVASSETAYLIHLYCITANPHWKRADLNELANPACKPETFRDHDPSDWAVKVPQSQQLLRELAARELGRLRPREAWLRENIEEPGRLTAREQARVLTGKELDLLTAERHHDTLFHRASKALNQRPRRPGRRPSPPRREWSDPAAPPPTLFDVPPPSERAPEAVLDYHFAHREVLKHTGTSTI